MRLFKSSLTPEQRDHPDTARTVRRARMLAVALTTVNLLNVGYLILLHGDPRIVTDAAWGRSLILLIAGLALIFFTTGLGYGSYRSYLCVRVESIALLVSVVVMIAIPGLLPAWMKIEQAVCGVILLALVLLVITQLRTVFSRQVRVGARA
jgi:hypothetical protein